MHAHSAVQLGLYKIGLIVDNQFHTGFVMEPPASSDPVKEACAPLADIDSEEEECHPVQQPQAHSIPHSSPPTGTAGVGPASHREEPLNEGSGEEEEVEHKAEKKHGESGQDSVECMVGLLGVHKYCPITINSLTIIKECTLTQLRLSQL